MRFEATTDTLDDTLTLELTSGEYTIPAVTAKIGLILKERMELFQAAAQRINAGEDAEKVNADIVEKHDISMDDLRNLGEMSLTKEIRDRMIEDGATLRELDRAEMSAFLFHTVNDGGEAAQSYWASGGKAQTPNRAQRRTGTQTRQGAATTTRKPASVTGTKRKAAASTKKASGGAKSSSTGTSSK